MNNNIELDNLINDLEIANQDLQGLLHALDCSVSEFMDPILIDGNSEEKQRLAIVALINEVHTVNGLIKAINDKVNEQRKGITDTLNLIRK